MALTPVDQQAGETALEAFVSRLKSGKRLKKKNAVTGGVNASHTERTARDKRQRAEFLRWSLLQYAHYGPHTNADGWTRDDALLALSSFCALIAIRNP